MQEEKIKRIVIYRIGAIGDIIHTLPLIKLVAEFNPQSTIELIVGSQQVKELIDASCNFITNVYVIKHKGIFDKPLKLFPKLDENEKALKESFAERKPDEFIYLHSNVLKAEVLNRRIVNAKKLFVYKRDSSLSAVSNYVTARYPDLKEDLLENPYLVLKSQTLKPKTQNLEPRTKFICIVLGVGALRPHRAYPLLKWVQFIDELLSKTDLNIKILGGPDEMDLSKEFEAILDQRTKLLKNTSYERVENLIGKTSLLDLAHILKASEKLYSADTGILHIGAALGIPIQSVFSITSEKRFGPFSPSAKVIRSSSCCCKKSSTNIPKHCSKPKYGYAGCIWGVTINQE